MPLFTQEPYSGALALIEHGYEMSGPGSNHSGKLEAVSKEEATITRAEENPFQRVSGNVFSLLPSTWTVGTPG